MRSWRDGRVIHSDNKYLNKIRCARTSTRVRFFCRWKTAKMSGFPFLIGVRFELSLTKREEAGCGLTGGGWLRQAAADRLRHIRVHPVFHFLVNFHRTQSFAILDWIVLDYVPRRKLKTNRDIERERRLDGRKLSASVFTCKNITYAQCPQSARRAFLQNWKAFENRRNGMRWNKNRKIK